ncbi:uncharacterized protein A4U43_C04F26990 [Asparagus officinalis]|uniref:FAD-binding domain-containing protein n=1 Tax=Asparagus officinalis TaxID=4686 RepID=A0A5P1F4P1_ASPOF|nr:uncharacterized protein LOC109836082 [Asparagus officinalis]ONK73084.1 uncharacterized protein A4U43_C04F26990 [Asparagus officinalis]
MEMRMQEEFHDIVIIGGGICGLATALGLHKKGIKSIVLERSETLRNTGAGIAIFLNGWHALDHLGVADQLRANSLHIIEKHNKRINKDGTEVIPISKEGLRCVRRSDLIEALANSLPVEFVRFGCQIVAIQNDPVTSFPIVHIADGSIIRAKILIGCDGSNSVVAKTLGLKPPSLIQTQIVQGLTTYPNGHGLSNHFLQLWGDRMFIIRLPADKKTVFWFVKRELNRKDQENKEDPGLIRDETIEVLKDFPTEVIEMVKQCDLNTISFHRIRYHVPWHLALSNISKGPMTASGDAVHQMDPSMAQGGSASLEDAVVLARCLSKEMTINLSESKMSDQETYKKAEVALQNYARERRWRILILSTKSHLIASLLHASWLKRFTFLTILSKFLGGRSSHTQYNCGHL